MIINTLFRTKKSRDKLKTQLILIAMLDIKEKRKLLYQNYDNEKINYSKAAEIIQKIRTEEKT